MHFKGQCFVLTAIGDVCRYSMSDWFDIESFHGLCRCLFSDLHSAVANSITFLIFQYFAKA